MIMMDVDRGGIKYFFVNSISFVILFLIFVLFLCLLVSNVSNRAFTYIHTYIT